MKVNINDFKGFITNHTIEETMRRFDISYAYVTHLSSILRVKAIRKEHKNYLLNDQQRKELAEYAKTHTAPECARKFNISPSLVISYSKRFGFNYLRRKIHGKKQNCEIKSIRRTGEAMDMIKTLIPLYQDASIARVFGYSRERIRQIRNSMGIEK